MTADKDVIQWMKRLGIKESTKVEEATGDDKFDGMMSKIQAGIVDPDELRNKIEKNYPGIDIDSRNALIDFTRYLLKYMDKGYKTPYVIKKSQLQLQAFNGSADPTVKKALNEFNLLASITGMNQVKNDPYHHEEDVLEIQYILFAEYKGNWDEGLDESLKLLIDGPPRSGLTGDFL